MENLALLSAGFANALTATNLAYALLGCLLGTMVGVLPGLGPTAGMAILLPVTAWLSPIPAIIMLSAIFYGAMYGGSTTAILINVPGEVSSVITAVDGYRMAQRGRAGAALAVAAISSFVAGTIALIGLTFFAPALASVALSMGPPEMLGLIVFSMSMIITLSGPSLLKGVFSAAMGILVGMVGLDPTLGKARFTFGVTPLLGGIDLIAVVMGLFALTEVFKSVASGALSISSERLPPWYRFLTFQELRASFGAMLRSSGLGFLLGCLPGMTPGVVSFMVYDAEKKVSRNSRNFGSGAIEGVAAAEGANNACSAANFVPMLTLGIPPSTSMAVLMSGLIIYGLQPGPLIFEKEPAFVWTVIGSMYIGNVILLVLNLPFVGLWAKLVRVPYYFIASLILLFCFIGTYTVRNSLFDVGTCLVFGIIGFLMDRLRISALPLVLGLILTPLFENFLRQTIGMGGGSLSVLAERPIAIGFLALGFITAAIALYLRAKGAGLARCLDAEEAS
ncbi:MAG TPA: tripartite tricarboxylate transporter permease [Thermodesulfobacteriota bacterium]